MTRFQRRIVIAIDEWLFWALIVVLYLRRDHLWPVALVVHAAVTYGLVYPAHWRWWNVWLWLRKTSMRPRRRRHIDRVAFDRALSKMKGAA